MHQAVHQEIKEYFESCGLKLVKVKPLDKDASHRDESQKDFLCTVVDQSGLEQETILSLKINAAGLPQATKIH